MALSAQPPLRAQRLAGAPYPTLRGRGKRRPGSMDGSCRGRHRAVAATAWPAVALPGKVLRRCRPVAVAQGVADPPKGGCVGPRALKSCTTPDSRCPARANLRSPDREGALRWRPGPLRAPPTRADHAVPPGAATHPEFLCPDRRDTGATANAVVWIYSCCADWLGGLSDRH